MEGRRRRLPRAALVRVGDHPALQPDGRLAHRADGNSRGRSGRRVARPATGTGRHRGEAERRAAGLSSFGVLDHLLVDVISTIRASFDRALLQRQAVEERFQVDVFLGDVSWETSYSLPGEEQPPRVRADVSVDWPTWSQTSYRSWSIGEPPDELPEVVIEVALRVQRMAEAPDTEKVMAALPGDRPAGRPDGPGPHRDHDRAGAHRRRGAPTAACAGPPRPPTRAPSASARHSWRTPRPSRRSSTTSPAGSPPR